MSGLADVVPIPVSINIGLSACREDTMLTKLGSPGQLTDKCSSVTGDVKRRIRYGVDVGPFKVSGLDYAIESLAQVLSEVAQSNPDAYHQVRTAGMLCIRRIKHNPAHYSNHSWGTAIDLYFGSGVIQQGKRATQRGLLALYGSFNRNGWYWGAGFSGSSVDSMHFELAEQTVTTQLDTPLSQDSLVAATDYIETMGR
jgi:hypothetical protein